MKKAKQHHVQPHLEMCTLNYVIFVPLCPCMQPEMTTEVPQILDQDLQINFFEKANFINSYNLQIMRIDLWVFSLLFCVSHIFMMSLNFYYGVLLSNIVLKVNKCI